MIRILLVDDCNILRQGIQALLEPNPKLKIVGTAENGHNAIEQTKIHLPDIVLMDIEMPVMSGITATQKICQQFPKTKVLVLSSHESSEYVTQALLAGASGYLLKNTLAKDLEQAIWSVYQGRSQIEAKLLRGVLAEASPQKVAMTATKKSIAESIQKTPPKLDSDRQSSKSSKNGLSSNKSETIIKPIEQSQSDEQFIESIWLVCR